MEFSPVFEVNYIEQKTGDITPYIELSNFVYKHNRYHIDIQASIDSEWNLETFWVSFAFDNEKRYDYPKEIVSILEKLKFTISEFDNSYEMRAKKEITVFHIVQELSQRLDELKST